MKFAVYADLARPLTSQERSTLFEALEANVPESGCVGPQKGLIDEVYFCLEAASEEVAEAEAARCMTVMLEEAQLDVEYRLALHAMVQRWGSEIGKIFPLTY